MAALLIETPTFDLAAAERIVRGWKLDRTAASDLRIDKGILWFQVGQEQFFVSPMPAPYPASDLDGPYQTSWMWPKDNPATNLRRHQSHVLVISTQGAGGPVARRVRLTQLTAALTKVPGVIGVHWPEATMLHYPPVFAKMAALASVEKPPLFLWVDYRVLIHEDGKSSLFTTGLPSIGLMEMEIAPIAMPGGELREWAMNITQYMYDRGASLPDGNTIGITADRQLKIRHVPPSHGSAGTVMRVG